MNSNKVFKIVLTYLLMSQYASAAQSLKWNVKHSEWRDSHEKLYEEFVAGIGMAKEKGLCHTTDQCLKHPVANRLFYKKNPKGLKSIYADCADLPHVLRAYFAWMNNLPFSYQSGVMALTNQDGDHSNNTSYDKNEAKKYDRAIREYQGHLQYYYKQYRRATFFKKQKIHRKIKEIENYLDKLKANHPRNRVAGRYYAKNIKKEDIRYTVNGNKITSRRIVKNGENINKIFTRISNSMSTASFRINSSNSDEGTLFSDFYPVSLDRKGITPGTVLYDPNGHVAVVYKVTAAGRIYMIDAHPDNSLTRISFGARFSRSPMRRGAGFSKFRSLRVSGGKHTAPANYELDNFSLQTYQGYPEREGVDMKGSKYYLNGKSYSYHGFIRKRLTTNSGAINPQTELKIMINDLCTEMKDRVSAVELARKNGISKKSHPKRLPHNIYGTEGEWENYSSPSRDARLKLSIQEIRKSMKSTISKASHSQKLISRLKKVYHKETRACKLGIQNSLGKKIKIDLDDAIERTTKFSFDPYHCVELRWGLLDDKNLANCADNENKFNWYRAEKRLRNSLVRDYAKKMDLTLSELKRSELGTGTTPKLSIRSLLYSY